MCGTLTVESCETTGIIDLYFGDPCGFPKLSLVSNPLDDPAYCSPRSKSSMTSFTLLSLFLPSSDKRCPQKQ